MLGTHPGSRPEPDRAARTIRRPYVLCWLPAVYLTLLHDICCSIRYREPAMLALIVLLLGRGSKQQTESSEIASSA